MTPLRQEIRFARTTDDLRIAYAVCGRGYPFVRAATLVSNLEHDWRTTILGPLFRELSTRYTLYRYNPRGYGLSEGDGWELSVETFVADLEAVVNDAKLERFALWGAAAAGSLTAIAYAARHPQRVSHLVLSAPISRGRMRNPHLTAQDSERYLALVKALDGELVEDELVIVLHCTTPASRTPRADECRKILHLPSSAAALDATLLLSRRNMLQARFVPPSLGPPHATNHNDREMGRSHLPKGGFKMKSEYSASVSVSLACAGLLTALLITPSLALAAPLFGVSVGSGNNNGCGNSAGSIGGSPIPVSDELICSTQIGTGAGGASATFGSVGAEARVTTVTGLSIPFFMGAGANFADTLTFSKTDPNAPNQFPVSLNLAFDGIVNAGAGIGGGAAAQVDIIVGFLSASQLTMRFSSDGSLILRGPNFNAPPDFAVIGTIAAGAGGFSTLLTTPQRLASVGDVLFSLNINTAAESIGSNGSATTDFLNTLEFPSGIDVFTLPDGYTVNAGSYLVNNRFIDPNASQVPEPTTLALVAIGLAGLAARRRKAA